MMMRIVRHLPALLGITLLGGAIYIVQREFRHIKLADIERALAAIPHSDLWIALGWTLLAYAILTLYDRLGAIYAGRVVSYGRVAFASFCAYTLAHNLGFAAVSGAAVRYRLYAQWGLTPLQIGKLVAFCSLTFALGGMVLGGIILLWEPQSVPLLGEWMPRWAMHLLGVGMWVGVVVYVLLAKLLGTVRMFGHQVELPGWRMSLLQVVLATVDLAVTAAILYALLPAAPGLSFLIFLGVYVAAYVAGLAANLPGGIGVFDTAMLVGLAPFLDASQIVGGIVVFRLYYYIIPLFLAGGLFAGNEMLLRGRGVMAGAAKLRGVQTIGRWSQPDFTVAVAAGTVALCGALLLCLGVLDARWEFAWLVPGWTLPGWAAVVFHPASEFVPSLIGAALLVLSLALTRRVMLAWGLTLGLLLVAAAFTGARGEQLWIPAMMLLGAGVLGPFRRAFYRRTRLFSGQLDVASIVALLVLVGCVLVLASFEPRLRDMVQSSWWQVILSADVPNGLRLSLAGAVGIALVAIWGLLRPGSIDFMAWDDAAQRRYTQLGATAPPDADGVVWGEAGLAAIPFRRVGGVLVGFGDPAGAAGDRVSAVWRMRDLALQEGLDPAFWRTGRALLDVYADLGLAALPLGADGLPRADAEDATQPHADVFLVCVAERDLPTLLPLLSVLAVEQPR